MYLNSFSLIFCKVHFKNGLFKGRGEAVGGHKVNPDLRGGGVDPVRHGDVEQVARRLVQAVGVDQAHYSCARIHGEDLNDETLKIILLKEKSERK